MRHYMAAVVTVKPLRITNILSEISDSDEVARLSGFEVSSQKVLGGKFAVRTGGVAIEGGSAVINVVDLESGNSILKRNVVDGRAVHSLHRTSQGLVRVTIGRERL